MYVTVFDKIFLLFCLSTPDGASRQMFDNRRVWSFTTFIIVLYDVFPIGAMLTSFHTKIVTE